MRNKKRVKKIWMDSLEHFGQHEVASAKLESTLKRAFSKCT